LFQHQTIAELAPVTEQREGSQVLAEQGTVTGPVELTPIQRWFFEQGFARPDHVNQSLLMEVGADLTGGQWQQVVRALLEQHDGLRTRFLREGGQWRAEVADIPDALPWQEHDLSSYPAAEREDRLVQIAQRIQSGMDVSASPLLRAALFTGLPDSDGVGAGGGDRLLLVAHHLVVDVVSWRVLSEDLDTLVEQVRGGREFALPAKTSSWRQWAERLRREGSSADTSRESDYWREQTAPVRALPLDGPVEGNTIGRSRVHEAVLSADQARALLQDVPAAFNTQVNDALLTAVASAVGAWTGDGHVRVDLEGHGREDLFDDIDVSRTVGWFTTISPVRLPVPDADQLAEGLKRTKELLRGRPRQGIGYGLLAYGLDHEGAETGSAGAEPEASAQVSFNYLGQFDGTAAGGFAAHSGKAGPDWDPANQRPYLIDIVSHVQDGRLYMRWTYDGDAFREETVRRVAEHTLEVLTRLTREARDPDAVVYSPSDFPAAGLDQEQVNDLVAQVRTLPEWRSATTPRPLADAYPQTPIQQGLWFQSQLSQGEGVYHVQMILRIDQELDTDAFCQAWAQVMRRHPIMRTGFRTTQDNQPLQLVWAEVPVPLQTQDWRSQTAEEQQERVDAYLRQDRAEGFDPQDAPQWRMLLVRTADDGYQLIWSAHHAILDGWSISLILNEAVQWYGAFTRGEHVEKPSARPYRDYVSWLGRQDIEEAEQYWRDTLKGVEQAAPLAIGGRSGLQDSGPVPPATVTAHLSGDETARLQEFAQRNRLTLNTVLQGCWALLLSRYSGTDDVVFGTVVSGRPSEIEGIERTVGLFINTLPLRVGVPEQEAALEWLHGLQEQAMRMRQFDYSPLSEVQRWSGLPSDASLFETLFVFENYPVEKDDSAVLQFEMTRSEERVNYPLAIVVVAQDRVEISAQYDPGRVDREAVERMLAHLQSVCAQIVRDPESPLSKVDILTEEERRQILQQGTSTASEVADDADFDLAALATDIESSEERKLLEQLVAEVQGMSPSDLQLPDDRDE
ncbi:MULTISPECIES: condensation domain-containing protein, partial [Nocardiopsis]|uniref:condensation domain-containing protein n=1 Tax=Nocardiopsis TaxID=2013 RepID=UPI001D05536F